jgi:adenine-specific DNA-methyltransferase
MTGRRDRGTGKRSLRQVEDYRHEESTRPNNPPAGLAWQDTEKPQKRRFEYDPHLDPQLVWAGKAERTSFDVEAPSVHVHERLSTEAIIRAVHKEQPQLALFEDEELDRSKQIEFYQHDMGWANRLILGDSLVVMTSLLEKERLGGQVQMIYIDPPYGIGYNSNFQPRVSTRIVKDRSDEYLTREPEQVQAFRDTWQVGIHSYLTYLRDRMQLARELLAESGSIFVQIGEDNVHLVRALLDEVFGRENSCSLIAFRKKMMPLQPSLLPGLYDYLVWYAKDKSSATGKFRRIFTPRSLEGFGWVELPDGTRRQLTDQERLAPERIEKGARLFETILLASSGRTESCVFEFELAGRRFFPPSGKSWKTNEAGMRSLVEKKRVMVVGNTPRYVFYADDYPVQELPNVWTDTGPPTNPVYVVQTSTKVVERCLLMTTDPGDLVVDPMMGSGTTCYVAEKWGRRWIGIDTSRVAQALSRERLLTSMFPYYRLADLDRGVDGGFTYKSVAHVTLGSLAQDRPLLEETLHDQPEQDPSIVRVSGPFTVEALSRYAVNPAQEDVPPEPDDPQSAEAQDHVEVLLGALRKLGIPRRGAKPVPIDSLQRIANAGLLQAEGTFLPNGSAKSFAVSLGPRFGAITVSHVDEALHDAYGYDLVVFAGFAATAEAQQYVAKGKLGRFEVALLEANPDLLVGDLLKTTSSSQTFRLFAAPDIQLKKDKDEYRVEVVGVDSYDASTGEVTSRGQKDIAAWFLDQDYDGIVFHVSQALFPKTGGWEALQRALKGMIDPELWEQLETFESLPFKAGEHKRVAVRVVDDSGTTSEALLELS